MFAVSSIGLDWAAGKQQLSLYGETAIPVGYGSAGGWYRKDCPLSYKILSLVRNCVEHHWVITLCPSSLSQNVWHGLSWMSQTKPQTCFSQPLQQLLTCSPCVAIVTCMQISFMSLILIQTSPPGHQTRGTQTTAPDCVTSQTHWRSHLGPQVLSSSPGHSVVNAPLHLDIASVYMDQSQMVTWIWSQVGQLWSTRQIICKVQKVGIHTKSPN